MIIFVMLLFMLLLLLLKGFFSGSEIALVSTDRPKLRHKAAQGHKGAKLASKMLAQPERLLATTLLGTNMSSIALTTVGTVLMVGLFGSKGELVAVIVFTPLFLIFGEIIPKSIYQQKADVLSPIIIYPLSWLQTLFMPLIWLLSKVASAVAGLLGNGEEKGDTEREQVMAMVNMAESSSDIVAFERGQVRRVFQFAQMSISEIMIPLSELTVAHENVSMKKLVAIRRQKDMSLIPLYRKGPSDICAVVRLTVWDLLDEELETKRVAMYHSDVRFVPIIQRVSETIELLRDDPDAIIVVVDEIGQAQGIVTLNRLVRLTLSGQEDRSLVGSSTIVKDANGVYQLDARLPIVDINDTLGTHLPTLMTTTLGGYVLSRLRHIPKIGESFVAEGYLFTVTDATEKAVLMLQAEAKSD
ncbi:MAG: hypothetical protein CR974_02525 [Gammaproteobacteria bacterium]|nr:MAG: hypothetical protein CR974_02525 [Gammaproteobacteria bacterium]